MVSAAADVNLDLRAIVRAGCFENEEEAVQEALRTLFVLKPHLRTEAAIRRYLDGEVSLARAAELTGMTRWRFQEVLAQRGHAVEIDAGAVEELEETVDAIRELRR